MKLSIRLLTPTDDLATFGRIVLDSYVSLPGHPSEPGYEAELVDVAGRVEVNPVFGAFDGAEPLGCVTYVPDASSPHAEDLADGEASFRMLAVARGARGRGIGAALVRRCLDEAVAAGRSAVFIYSGDWMTAAHRMYGRLGFRRVPGRDRQIEEPPIRLLAFVHGLE